MIVNYARTNTLTAPLEVTFTDIHNNNLGISICDPYDYIGFAPNNVHRNSNIEKLLLQIQSRCDESSDFVKSVLTDEYGNILLSKTNSMYKAISELMYEFEEVIASVNTEVEVKEVFISDQNSFVASSIGEMHGSIRDIKPFYFLDSQKGDSFEYNDHRFTMILTKSSNIGKGE